MAEISATRKLRCSMISYWPSIVIEAVSVAVCEIYHVRGHSRSLKMAPFDRPYATFYWSAIVI